MSIETDHKPVVRQKFIDSIDYIRNYLNENLIKHKGTETFAEWFTITCSQVQFECQKNHMFLFYRYDQDCSVSQAKPYFEEYKQYDGKIFTD